MVPAPTGLYQGLVHVFDPAGDYLHEGEDLGPGGTERRVVVGATHSTEGRSHTFPKSMAPPRVATVMATRVHPRTGDWFEVDVPVDPEEEEEDSEDGSDTEDASYTLSLIHI